MSDTNESRTPNRKWLAMDTSNAAMSIALLENGQPIAQFSSEAERNHSILLLPAIVRLLEENGLTPAELDGIAVGRGPGSYTGVRIAISVAKTMAWALELPVLAVSGLEAMALGAWRAEGASTAKISWYVPLLDARRKQAFTALYGWQGGQRSTIVQDSIRLVPDWVDEIGNLFEEQSAVPDRIVFLGETAGFMPEIERLRSLYPERIDVLQTGIGADAIGELAWERWVRGERDELHGLAPNYTQLAEAEKNWLEKDKARQGGDSVGGVC